ncbi:MAG: (2Fe-2S) ferredoxin domain-containing protein [Leptolyngbyaceae cyanobacterium SM2_3_12]|nr:(2Fe-2S) ferredoxin domain-containing protein [Leptolyngbyaceae cyanobacterium SM2_3_12]
MKHTIPLVQLCPGLPRARCCRGQYTCPYRSSKGKIKGLILRVGSGEHLTEYHVKLPKYLRPMLVRELQPGAMVQVLAYPEDDRWRALNLTPWVNAPYDTVGSSQPEQFISSQAVPTSKAKTKSLCVEVCRKGKCHKQGSHQILTALEAEVKANPDLQHVSIKPTGCLKACKHGPNLRLRSSGQVVSCPTPQKALAVLAKAQ